MLVEQQTEQRETKPQTQEESHAKSWFAAIPSSSSSSSSGCYRIFNKKTKTPLLQRWVKQTSWQWSYYQSCFMKCVCLLCVCVKGMYTFYFFSEDTTPSSPTQDNHTPVFWSWFDWQRAWKNNRHPTQSLCRLIMRIWMVSPLAISIHRFDSVHVCVCSGVLCIHPWHPCLLGYDLSISPRGLEGNRAPWILWSLVIGVLFFRGEEGAVKNLKKEPLCHWEAWKQPKW